MAIGIVFVYLAIAALAAPLAWMLWWGADSVAGTGRLQEAAAPVRGARNVGPAQGRFGQPQPADFTLARHPREVTIHRLSDSAQVGACSGPDHSGKCPRAHADGTVPCAGTVLALPRPVRGSAEWHIPSGYRACMLGSYDVFRQAGSAT